MLVAFTGLARYKSFDTYEFLLSSLMDSGEPDFTAKGIIERTTARLNDAFTNVPLSSLARPSKHLTVSFIGYNYAYSPPAGIAAEIGNRKDDGSIGDFRPLFFGAKPAATGAFDAIFAFGDARAIDLINEPHLRRALSGTVGPGAIEKIISRRVREVAVDPRTKGGVGQQLDVLRLSSDPSEPILAHHLSMVNKRDLLTPGMVSVVPGGQMATQEMRVWTEEERPLTIGPVHRNAPCPCGSGKRYRNCHRL